MNGDRLHAKLLEIAARCGGPLLALDTSGAAASVCAVGFRPEEVHELLLDASAMPSESLGAALAQEARTTSFDLCQLAGVVIGLGPGSFTGLRVGLATAKGLSLGSGVPLYGASSLAMLAASAGAGRVAPVIEARRGEIFVAVYDVDADGNALAVVQDHATTPSAARLILAEHASEQGLTLVGGGVAALAAVGQLPGRPKEPMPSLRAGFGIVHAAERLVERRSEDVGPLAPRYLKLSEAERSMGS